MKTQLHGLILAGVHRWQNTVLERVVLRILVPMGDRTLTAHVIEWIRRSGVTNATMCANSDTSALRNAFGDGKDSGIDLRYFEDHMPRGPAGCMRDAAVNLDVENMVVVDATILPYTIDLAALVEAHTRAGAALTVAATSDARSAGTVSTPVGVFIVSRRVLSLVPETGYQDIKQGLIPRLHAAGEKVLAFDVPSPCPRIKDSETYFQMVAWLLEYQAAQSDLEIGYSRLNDTWIHESAQVHASSRLMGRVHVGPNAVVEKGATVIGPTIIGRSCSVREDAVVSRSAIWDGAIVGARAVVDRCIQSFGADARPGKHYFNQIIESGADAGRQAATAWAPRRSNRQSLAPQKVR